MQIQNVIFGTTNILCGVIFILVSLPLVKKKVPMNRYYGFRIAKAFVSDDNWYKINSYGGRQFIRWAIALIMIGILYFIVPLENPDTPILNLVVAMLPMIICVIAAIYKTLIYSRRL